MMESKNETLVCLYCCRCGECGREFDFWDYDESAESDDGYEEDE